MSQQGIIPAKRRTRYGREDLSSGCVASYQHFHVQKQILLQMCTRHSIRDESGIRNKYAGTGISIYAAHTVTVTQVSENPLSFFLVCPITSSQETVASGRKASEVFELSGAGNLCERDQCQAYSVQSTGPPPTEVTTFLKMIGKSLNKNVDPLFYPSSAGDFWINAAYGPLLK